MPFSRKLSVNILSSYLFEQKIMVFYHLSLVKIITISAITHHLHFNPALTYAPTFYTIKMV